MTAEHLKPDQYSEWDSFVNSHPLSTIFHLSAWNRIAEKVYQIRNAIIVSRGADGKIRSGTPVFFVKRPGSWYVTSGIFGAYGPLLVREGEDQQDAIRDTLDAAVAYARENRAKFMHLKTLEGPKGKFEFSHISLERQDVWVTAFMSVGGTSEDLWKSLPGQMRSKVRKAEKSELTLRWGNSDQDIDQFYDVLADNMHRKGSPIYGREIMTEIMREFGAGGDTTEGVVVGGNSGQISSTDTSKTEASILTLHLGDEVVSGALVLRHAGVVYVPFVSSRAKFFPLRPNNFLYWEIIRDSNRRGQQWLDFGTSIRGASTLQFKESWGAATYPVVSWVYSESGEAIRLDAGASAVQLGVEIWKKLPRGVVDRLGPKLARLMV